MAFIQNKITKKRVYLLTHHTFGRREDLADTVSSDPKISKIHAAFEWNGQHWSLKDLSKNGIWVNGEKLEKFIPRKLKKNMQLSFNRENNEIWVIKNLDPPNPLLLIEPELEQVIPLKEVTFYPSDADPKVIFHYDKQNMSWCYSYVSEEQTCDAPHRLTHGDVLKIENVYLAAFIPPEQNMTVDATKQTPIYEQQLHFNVSLNEEHVALEIHDKNNKYYIGDNTYMYLLLHLARRKIYDMEQGFKENDQGWIDNTLLSHELGIDEAHINIQIFRLRQRFLQTIKTPYATSDIIQRRRGSTRIGILAQQIIIDKGTINNRNINNRNINNGYINKRTMKTSGAEIPASGK